MTFQKMTSLSLARMYKTELLAQRMASHMYANTLHFVSCFLLRNLLIICVCILRAARSGVVKSVSAIWLIPCFIALSNWACTVFGLILICCSHDWCVIAIGPLRNVPYCREDNVSAGVRSSKLMIPSVPVGGPQIGHFILPACDKMTAQSSHVNNFSVLCERWML